MKLKDIKNQYASKLITKNEYIEKMHKIHDTLFDYSEFIHDTDIAKIEIIENEVMMTTKRANIKIICDKYDLRLIPIEILNFGTYEKNELQMILKLTDESATIFDIGGNIGWISMNISRYKTNANIFTFEPIPKTYRYLKRNVELNAFTNIHINNFGFSNEEKELTFFYYPEGSGNASLENLSNNPNTQKTICSVKRLDDYVFDNNLSVDFIKCDVEGAELLVFQGGIETLKKFRPIVFTEMLRKWAAKFGYHPREIIELFRGIGYKCFTIHENILKEFFEMNEETLETNFFFLHSENHTKLIERFVTK